MKNLNPKSGLKQISSGKLYLPRRLILELIRDKKIKVNELGYYIIALISADWSDGEYRYGLIRREIKQLTKTWNIHYSTFNDNLNKLLSIGLLSKKHGVFSIDDFEHFAKASGKYSNKNTTSNEDLKLIFGNSLLESEVSDPNQSKKKNIHRVSHKVKHIKNIKLRTNEDYQRIKKEGNYLRLTVDDMRWLDHRFDAQGKYLVNA